MKNLSKNIALVLFIKKTVLELFIFIQRQKKYFLKNLSKNIFLGLFISILYFTIIFLSVNFAGLSFLDATKDNPFLKNRESIFYGLISNLGIFLWISSLTLNVYGYVINKKFKNIFLIGILTSATLLITDLFDLQNLYQKPVYFFLMINSFFLFFYNTKFPLIKNKLISLFLSFSFFFTAMFIDIFQGYKFFLPVDFYSRIVEELFEFLGGFYYLFYWIDVIRKINKLKNKQTLIKN